jgi:hypothetical protein
MVRALLDGRKTQTRRVLKPPYGTMERTGYGAWKPICTTFFPGDRLWVREAFCEFHPAGVQEGRFSIDGQAGIPGPPSVRYRVIYRADGDPVRVWHCDGFPYRTTAGPRDALAAKYPGVCSDFPGWYSPIHMPRWASRLTLTVTDVRVQRVQDISETDAVAEGVYRSEPTAEDYEWKRAYDAENGYDSGPLEGVWLAPGTRRGYGGTKEQRNQEQWGPTAAFAFRCLWNSLHGPDAWDANPWVAAITFTVERRNIDAGQP